MSQILILLHVILLKNVNTTYFLFQKVYMNEFFSQTVCLCIVSELCCLLTKQFDFLQDLRNFCLEVHVPAKYHTSLIGRQGHIVNKICADYGVQIVFPRQFSEHPDIIVIQGLEEKAREARDDILQRVHEMVC